MMLKSYLTYRKQRNNAHGVHSPFVFEFYNEILAKANNVDDAKIQFLRKKLLKDNSEIYFLELGAGSRKGNKDNRRIAEIAKTSGIDRKYGKLLTRIIDYYKLENCLELGTSLGIGTSYLALSPSIKKIITIEGSPEAAKKAALNFEELELDLIDLIVGNFDNKLEEALAKFDKLDLVFIDGNHRYESTINYFEILIDKIQDETILIFDDIHWSDEMEKAWCEIIASPKVNVTIDLFRMGIVIKKKDQAKEHFVLKY